MRIVRRHGDFIHKAGAKLLDGAFGGVIIWIARDRDFRVNRPRERRQRLTGLPRETVTAERLNDFVTDVPGTLSNMLGIAYTEIDVPDVQVGGDENPEM